MSTFLDFLNRAKETNSTIAELSECVSIADSLKAQSASAQYGTHEEIAEVMMRIQNDFRTKAEETKKTLERMREENKEHFNVFGYDRGFAARHTHLQSLAQRLGLVVEDFRRVQRGFVKHEGERLKTQYLIANPKASQEELVALEDREKGRTLLQEVFTVGSKSAKEIVMRAERRRSSIETILQGVSELKELSDDFLAYLVTNDAEMDRVRVDVKASAGQTMQAEKTIEMVADRKIRVLKAKKTVGLVCGGSVALIFIYIFFRAG